MGFQRMHMNYRDLLELWEHALSTEKGLQSGIKARIIGVSTKMKSFHFLWHLELAINACDQKEKLSKILQNTRMNFIEVKELGDSVV